VSSEQDPLLRTALLADRVNNNNSANSSNKADSENPASRDSSYSAMDEPHNDPVKKDNKHLPMSKLSSVLPKFMLSVCVLLPVWSTFLLPATILSLGCRSVCRAICGGPKRLEDKDVAPTPSVAPATGGKIYCVFYVHHRLIIWVSPSLVRLQ
jgi:hypothetical protein